MNRFNIHPTPLSGLKLIERKRIGDSRGWLDRLFCSEELDEAGWVNGIAQINHTFTEQQGTVRGLHYQAAPFCEDKLVICLKGEIWDVAVDLRKDSASLLSHYGTVLSADNQLAMFIPKGFAHGYQTLSNHCELLYLHSAPYNASAEMGLNPNDVQLDIPWPGAIKVLSDRDQSHPMINGKFPGISP